MPELKKNEVFLIMLLLFSNKINMYLEVNGIHMHGDTESAISHMLNEIPKFNKIFIYENTFI